MVASSPAYGTWLERAGDAVVGAFSPRRAYLRSHFRRMGRDEEYREAVHIALRAMGYTSATTGKNETPWNHVWGPRSADAEVLLAAEPLRNKVRELKRNDAVASGLLKAIPREVVGTGIRPKSSAKDKAVRDALNAVFAERSPHLFPSDGIDLYEHQLLAIGKVAEDGEVWIKEAVGEPGEPIWFETVEADRVDSPAGALPTDPEGTIRAGVEKDRHGRIVAYHVSKTHPGDNALAKTVGKVPVVSPPTPQHYQRVSREVCKHLKITERPGQSRGITFLHAVLQDLRDLDLLMTAVLKRFQISASLAVFLESEDSLGDIFSATAVEAGYQLDQDIRPGMIFKLMPGEKVSTVSPNFPIPDLEKLVILIARRIGAAVGVCWQTVLSDFSTSNYSAARTDLLRDRRLWRFLQHKLISGYLEWVWVRVLEDAALRGDRRMRGVTPEDIRAVSFIAPGWEWVDPQKQAAAVALMLALGLSTKQREAAALGLDWEEIQDQQLREELRERERREELGLDPKPIEDSDPIRLFAPFLTSDKGAA